jgi:nitrogen fixation/metabolism regulation signal transduction histidine kinase
MTKKAPENPEHAVDEFEAADGIRLLMVITLSVIVGLQALLLAWGLHYAATASADVPRPDQQLYFFKAALLFLVPVVAVNAALGAFLAEKLVKPLERMRRAMAEVARGNLEHPFESDPDELLQAYTAECEHMLDTLRRLLYRDRGHADEANERLTRCQSILDGRDRLGKEEREKVEALLAEAKSYLSMVNDHFLKGKRGAP